MTEQNEQTTIINIIPPTMPELLRELAWIRSMMEQNKQWMEKAKAKIAELPEWKELEELKTEQEVYSKKSSDIDTLVRTMAISLFDGNKHPIKGVEIKEVTEIYIKDEKAAKIWAANNAPSTLTISVSKFNPAVKNLELDFIELKEEPKAYIATNLSEYLPK